MNPLMIKILILTVLFSGWSGFMYKSGVNACKVKFEKASDKQFNATLDEKQIELDAAIKKSNEWRAQVDILKKRKPPKVKHEKTTITKNNSGCTSIDGFGLFWSKLQERQPKESTESN
jgi:hypothetical protein